MALLDHEPYGRYNDDYRAYLVSQNQPPISYESGGLHFKRLGAYARAVITRLTGWGSAVYSFILAAKQRRLARELMLHGVSYRHALDDAEGSPARSSNLRHGKRRLS